MARPLPTNMGQPNPFGRQVRRQGAADSVPVLLYHHFVRQGPENSATVSAQRFRQQMKWLRDNDYSTATMDQLHLFLRGKLQLPVKTVVITIDDGYYSAYDIAYPILAEYDLQATVFAIGASRGKVPGQYPHFTWWQAREMVDSGVIEVHSHTHNLHHLTGGEPAMAAASRETILLDLICSRVDLVDHLSSEPIAFAYPYGRGAFDPSVKELVGRAGFKLAFGVQPGRVGVGADPLALPRLNVTHQTGLADFIKLVQGT